MTQNINPFAQDAPEPLPDPVLFNMLIHLPDRMVLELCVIMGFIEVDDASQLPLKDQYRIAAQQYADQTPFMNPDIAFRFTMATFRHALAQPCLDTPPCEGHALMVPRLRDMYQNLPNEHRRTPKLEDQLHQPEEIMNFLAPLDVPRNNHLTA